MKHCQRCKVRTDNGEFCNWCRAAISAGLDLPIRYKEEKQRNKPLSESYRVLSKHFNKHLYVTDYWIRS